MKALSIRQPWAWAILHAGKDVENRRWATNFRGRVLLHAAKGCTRDEYEDAAFWIGELGRVAAPPLAHLDRGAIVGAITIVDCIPASTPIGDSRWRNGQYAFVLRDPVACPPIPCRGALGFFEVDEAVAAEARRTIGVRDDG